MFHLFFHFINLIQASSLSFSSSGKSWEISSSADVEPTTFRLKETSVDTWCHHVFQPVSNTNSKGVLVLLWINHGQILQANKVTYLFTHNSANFLHPTNQ